MPSYSLQVGCQGEKSRAWSYSAPCCLGCYLLHAGIWFVSQNKVMHIKTGKIVMHIPYALRDRCSLTAFTPPPPLQFQFALFLPKLTSSCPIAQRTAEC